MKLINPSPPRAQRPPPQLMAPPSIPLLPPPLSTWSPGQFMHCFAMCELPPCASCDDRLRRLRGPHQTLATLRFPIRKPDECGGLPFRVAKARARLPPRPGHAGRRECASSDSDAAGIWDHPCPREPAGAGRALADARKGRPAHLGRRAGDLARSVLKGEPRRRRWRGQRLRACGLGQARRSVLAK